MWNRRGDLRTTGQERPTVGRTWLREPARGMVACRCRAWRRHHHEPLMAERSGKSRGSTHETQMASDIFVGTKDWEQRVLPVVSIRPRRVHGLRALLGYERFLQAER